MRARPNPKLLEKQCEEFNEANPIGTRVMAYRLTNPRRDPKGEARTRSRAFVLEGHTAVVFIEGETGCVALDSLQVLKKEGTVAP